MDVHFGRPRQCAGDVRHQDAECIAVGCRLVGQAHLPSLAISSDAQAIAQALQAVVDRLQQAAKNCREHGSSLELLRCALMSPGELFYDEAHHQFLLLLIAQQLAQQQFDQECLARLLGQPHSTNSRGPPVSNFKLHYSHVECSLAEVPI